MRAVSAAVLAIVLALGGTACGQADEAVEQGQQALQDVRSRAEQVADTARFCASLLELLGEVREGRYREAARSASEAAGQVPRQVRQDVRTLLEAARAARRQQNPAALDDPEVRRAADRLRTFASDRCNPAG